MRLRCWAISVAALATLLVLAMVPSVRAEGVEPCLASVRQDYKDCKAGCRENYQLAKDTCMNRDHACVENCRADRQVCRQPIVDALNADLAVCNADLEEAKGICRQLYADGTVERDTCIDNAQVVAFLCRKSKRMAARLPLKACRSQFKECVVTNCPPLSIPDP